MSTFRINYRDRDGGHHRTRRWHVEFKDHLGRRQRVPGFADRPCSKELERKLIRLAALRATDATPDAAMRRWIEGLAPGLRDKLAGCGMLTMTQVAALRPLSELLDDWEAHLRARGSTEGHVRLVASRARKVIEGISAGYWSAIDATRVEQFLQTEREKDGGISARTSNFYLQSVRQFCRWAVRTGVGSEDPLRVLRPIDAQSTRQRRALTAEELARLLATTRAGPPRDGSTGDEREGGIPGPERALLYRMAAETGLRRNELRTLHVTDLDIADTERANVSVRATNTKNRREAHLPLRPDLATELRAHVRERLPTARVFTLPKDFRAAVLLRADLAVADIEYEDAAGRVVDFHSLRVTFGTNLARGGVALQLAQRLLRHSTPVLTANVYTVLGRDDDRKAIEKLPDVGAQIQVEAARATGTDGSGRTAATPRHTSPRVAPSPGRTATPSSPTDARVTALLAAWDHLDDHARGALVQTAELLARQS